MPVDLTGKPERRSSSVPGELSGTTTPVGVRASVHNTRARGSLLHLAVRLADELRPALEGARRCRRR